MLVTSMMIHMNSCIYRVCWGNVPEFYKNVPWGRLNQYNQKHLYLKLHSYRDNGQRSLKESGAVIPLLITKYILKLVGISNLCNINNCT